MLLVYLLVICLVSLLAFSLSRETGKNTVHARKGSNAIVQKQEKIQSFSVSKVIEVN